MLLSFLRPGPPPLSSLLERAFLFPCGTQAMFPLIFVGLWKFPLCNSLPELTWIWNDVYKICARNSFGRNIYVHSKFSCVRLSHNLCARLHAHSLEGTLDTSWECLGVNSLHWKRHFTSLNWKRHITKFSSTIQYNTIWLNKFSINSRIWYSSIISTASDKILTKCIAE